jgi:1,2-dihydroxy-3-keto-5-methylthiopentene dioxygenase
MSALAIYPEDYSQNNSAPPIRHNDFDSIARELAAIGVTFERWQAGCALTADADQEAIIAAYRTSIDRLMQTYGFQSVDVINLNPDHPQKAEFRQKFLAEHTHDDFEVRFFIEGCGLFYLHAGGKVYLVLCEAGDLISVPTGVTHWFDMGEAPQFKVIRLFTTPEGWVANFTGSQIHQNFPTLDVFKAQHA